MSEIGKIRVRFVTSHDIVSWTIRGAEMGFLFSHAEVAMPDGTLLGAHADGGVEARPWGYDAKYDPVEMFAEIAASDATIAAVHDYLLAQIGKPYDFGAIEAFALGFSKPIDPEAMSQAPWQDPSSWFCSELVAAALDRAKVFPNGLPIPARHVTPRDLCFLLAPIAALSKPARIARPQAQVEGRPV